MCITTAATISILSVCVAVAAVWTSREKLRLDLYNRRFDIYSRTLQFLHLLETWRPTDLEKASTSLQESPELEKAQRAFTIASREALFLFDDASEVHKLLEQLHADTIGVIGFKRDLGPKMTHPELAKNHKCDELQKRIRDSVPLLEKGMKKYLDFHALSVWRWW